MSWGCKCARFSGQNLWAACLLLEEPEFFGFLDFPPLLVEPEMKEREREYIKWFWRINSKSRFFLPSLGLDASNMGWRILRLAFMNQLFTWRSVKFVWDAICLFSSSVGYGCFKTNVNKKKNNYYFRKWIKEKKRKLWPTDLPLNVETTTNAWRLSRAWVKLLSFVFFPFRLKNHLPRPWNLGSWVTAITVLQRIKSRSSSSGK